MKEIVINFDGFHLEFAHLNKNCFINSIFICSEFEQSQRVLLLVMSWIRTDPLFLISFYEAATKCASNPVTPI